jgi:hypothetical protein
MPGEERMPDMGGKEVTDRGRKGDEMPEWFCKRCDEAKCPRKGKAK